VEKAYGKKNMGKNREARLSSPELATPPEGTLPEQTLSNFFPLEYGHLNQLQRSSSPNTNTG